MASFITFRHPNESGFFRGLESCQHIPKSLYFDFFHFYIFFSKECKDGYFGGNCSKKCGQCDDNIPCDKAFGYCLRGCKQNFQPPLCNGKFHIILFKCIKLIDRLCLSYLVILFIHIFAPNFFGYHVLNIFFYVKHLLFLRHLT